MLQCTSAVGLCSVRVAAKSNRLRVQQLVAIGPGGAEGTAEGQEAEAVGKSETRPGMQMASVRLRSPPAKTSTCQQWWQQHAFLETWGWQDAKVTVLLEEQTGAAPKPAKKMICRLAKPWDNLTIAPHQWEKE